MAANGSGQHSSLLQYGNNYRRKKFQSKGLRVKSQPIFSKYFSTSDCPIGVNINGWVCDLCIVCVLQWEEKVQGSGFTNLFAAANNSVLMQEGWSPLQRDSALRVGSSPWPQILDKGRSGRQPKSCLGRVVNSRSTYFVIWSKTAKLRVENSAQTTFRLSPASTLVQYLRPRWGAYP